MVLRPAAEADLGWITALERRPDHLEAIGQWSDDEHLRAIRGEEGREVWIVEREGVPAAFLIAYDCRAHDAGFYVKRLLVGDKDRGTGRAALGAFVRHAFARRDAGEVWLIVREANARAQAVYSKLGFTRFMPTPEEAARYAAAAETPGDNCFRMRLPRDGQP